MVRLTVTLFVAIYIILIVVPDRDHGENVAVTRAAGQNWLVALISDAETNAQTPPRDRRANAARTVRTIRITPDEALIETQQGLVLRTADGEMLQITAVIDPVDLLPDAADPAVGITALSVAETAVPETAAPDTAREVADAPRTEAPVIWRVSGDRVNFRAGPSTETAILTALVRGDEVAVLAEGPEDWAHLRVMATGLEGYMAIRFLEPVN